MSEDLLMMEVRMEREELGEKVERGDRSEVELRREAARGDRSKGSRSDKN
jgi:hypothetical protein